MAHFYSVVPKIPIFFIKKTQNLLQEHRPNFTKNVKDVLKTKPKNRHFPNKSPYNIVHFYSAVQKKHVFH